MAHAPLGIRDGVNDAVGDGHFRSTLALNRDDGGAHLNGVALCSEQLAHHAFERGRQFD